MHGETVLAGLCDRLLMHMFEGACLGLQHGSTPASPLKHSGAMYVQVPTSILSVCRYVDSLLRARPKSEILICGATTGVTSAQCERAILLGSGDGAPSHMAYRHRAVCQHTVPTHSARHAGELEHSRVAHLAMVV